MASIWFVRGGGKVYGPLDSGKLKQLVSDGKIDQTTEIAQNQAGPWFAAGKVQGLFAASDATPRPLPMSAAIATSPNAKDKFVLPEAAPNGVGSNACQPNSARSFRHWYRQAVGCLSIPLQIITWLCRFFISLWLGKQVTKPESQTGDGAEGFILCPDCGANVVAPVQSALADNPEYKEAKNIHMGLHSWRVYLKKKAFLVLGFVTWYHDLIDGVVKNLCAQAGETVDSATQSFSWRWTIGWFSGPTPEVSEHITKAYNWFSFVSTVLLWAGFLWLTRWSYFTQKMENFEGNKVKENKSLALTWFFWGLVLWLCEYVVIGLIIRVLCRESWPPVVPTLTSNLIFFSAFAMCLLFDALARWKSNT